MTNTSPLPIFNSLTKTVELLLCYLYDRKSIELVGCSHIKYHRHKVVINMYLKYVLNTYSFKFVNTCIVVVLWTQQLSAKLWKISVKFQQSILEYLLQIKSVNIYWTSTVLWKERLPEVFNWISIFFPIPLLVTDNTAISFLFMKLK